MLYMLYMLYVLDSGTNIMGRIFFPPELITIPRDVPG